MPENSIISRLKGKISECGIARDTWMVVIALLMIFFLAFFLRAYFGLGEATAYGTPYLVSGGSDSYYHERAINTAAYEHHSLLKDPMLNYPIGKHNPRPPAYDWSIVVMGYIISPFLGGDLASALSYSLIFSSVIWGSLTVFPTYFIGKKIFNRRVGIISAFLLAVMPAHMQKSILTLADHDPFVLFFVTVSIYFLLVALEKVKEKEWVENWRDFSSIKKGFAGMKKENRSALLYAGLAGAAAMTIALTWKGFSYLYFIVAVYFIFQIFVNRFRNVDTLTLTSVAFMSMGLPLLLAAPYYFISSQTSWLIAPAIMTVGILLVGLYFSITYRFPWTLSIPILAGILGVVGVSTYFLYPSLIEKIGRQTGYFTVSKLYQTIAEAQAPYISNMIMSFGPVTFFMALIGILWIIWKMRKRWLPSYVFFVIWSAVSIYMALTSARFMFNAAPAFAIASGWIVFYLIKEADFSTMKKTYRSLSGNKIYAVKKSVGIKHILITLFLVFMVVMPNVWYATDAGIPSNDKKEYDLQVYNSMPDFMRPDSSLYNASNQRDLWYFGAFGYQLPTPNQYWPASWSWFKQQDTEVLPEDRPAFLSWWDYGFESIQEGEHPAVADNFQNGYQLAGNFIMAQNETEAISLLILRMLDAEYNSKDGEFSERSLELMHHYLTDEEVNDIVDMYRHPQSYVDDILANPEKYGPYDSSMDATNARYVAARGILQTYDEKHLVDMLKSLEDMTGKRISYFAIDSRLIPFSAQNTGIFYAPAVLSDHRISEGNYRLPYDFYMIYAVTKYGKRYPINEVPDDERNNIDHTEIEYTDMFYNTMLYRNYFGYSPKEVGIGDNGLPGLSDNLKKNMPMPGWNLTHFRLVYRTAYWNPYKDYKNHTDAWQAVSMEEAMKHQQEGDGVVDMSPGTLYNGVTYLEYYEGAIVNGTVRTPDGSPVGNVRLTVYDDYGIPHQTVMSDENGRYSIIAPFGNATILVSNGGSMDKIRMSEKNILNSTHLSIERYQAWREKIDMDGDGQWDYLIHRDPVVKTSSVSGNVYIDVNNNGAKDDDESGAPAEVTLYGKSLEINYTVQAGEDGSYEISSVVPGDYGLSIDYNGFIMDLNVTITVEPSKAATQDVAIPTGNLKGRLTFPTGNYAAGMDVHLYAVDSRNWVNFTTEGDGAYYVKGIIPGIYQMDMVSENFTIGNTRIGIPQNSTISLNTTVYPAAVVEGYATLNGKAIPNLGINFINYTDTLARRSVITDENGYFSVKIPMGTYTISATYISGGNRWVLMKSLDIRGDMQVEFEMERSYEVRGYIKYLNYYKDTFPISFIRPDGARMDFYSIDGNYTAYLPEDTYHVYVSYAFAGFPYTFSTHAEIPSQRILNIDLIKGAKIKGSVTGVEYSPIIRGNIEFISNETGDSFETYTDQSGTYEYHLLPGNYTVIARSLGYSEHVSYINLSAGDELEHNISMIALQTELKGTVYLGDSPAPGVNISFYGYNTTYNTTTDDDGNYSITLYGGVYTIIVSQYLDDNQSAKYELVSRQTIYVDPYADTQNKDLNIEKRYRVSGRAVLDSPPLSNSYVIYFSNGSVEYPFHTRDGNFTVYLPVGNYIINSTASSMEGLFAIYRAISVSAPLNLSMDYETAHMVTVKMDVNGKQITGIPLNVSLGDSVKTYMSNDDISLQIPSGTYRFWVNYTRIESIDNIDRNVTYTGSVSVDISSDRDVALHLDRYVPQGSLSATLKVDGRPVEDTGEVTLKSMDDGSEYLFPVSSDGSFDASVPMGAYVLYASGSAGDNRYAVMDRIVIGENTVEDIPMKTAAVFSGKTMKEDGTGLNASVSIISSEERSVQMKFSSDENGHFSITLPRGNYTVISSAETEEYGVQTRYVSNFQMNFTFSTDMNIVLSRVDVHKPVLEWSETERESAWPGESVTYHIRVKNGGNTPDKYSFSTDVWNASFEPESVYLEPGESALIDAVITVPEDATAGHNMVSVIASPESSPEDNGDVGVDIVVKEVIAVEIGDISDSSWEDGNAIYSVSVKNTGNSPNSFVVAASDRDALNSLGWDMKVSSSRDGPYSDSASITIGPGASSDVYVKLIPVAENPAYNVSFSVLAHSENGASAEAKLRAPLPSVEIKPDVSVSGENVAIWNPEPLDMTPIYWAIAIVVALAAIYIIGRKKGVIL